MSRAFLHANDWERAWSIYLVGGCMHPFISGVYYKLYPFCCLPTPWDAFGSYCGLEGCCSGAG